MFVLNVVKFAPFPVFLLFTEFLFEKIKGLFQASDEVTNARVLLNCVVLLKTVLVHIVRVFVQILEYVEYEAVKAIELEYMKPDLVFRDLFLEEIVHKFVLPHGEN